MTRRRNPLEIEEKKVVNMKDKYDVSMRRKFGGKYYYLRAYASNKRDATAKASKARKNGIKARVIKRSNGTYVIYGRE